MKLSSLLVALTLLSFPASSLAQEKSPAKQRKKAPDMDTKKTKALVNCMEKCQGPSVSCMEKCGDSESCTNRCGEQFSQCLLKACEGLVPEPTEEDAKEP
ncbi:hypothetical protein [Archangium sp.]|uniref:hypothetical protein n=1 Tax=Archangium sp. TaxID=1872627 RepID=UPI00286D12D5|nr:hypothetical protein [Archangium sp.]